MPYIKCKIGKKVKCVAHSITTRKYNGHLDSGTFLMVDFRFCYIPYSNIRFKYYFCPENCGIRTSRDV